MAKADIKLQIEGLKELSEMSKLTSTIKKNMASINAKEIEAKRTRKELTEEEKRALQVNKQIEKNERELQRVIEKKNNALIKSRLELQKANKEKKQDIIISNAQKQSYEAINTARNKNIATWKQMSKYQRESTKEGKLLTATLQKQGNALKKLDAQMGMHNRNVGNYAGALRNTAGALIGAFGVVGGIQMFAQVLRNAFDTIKQFQKANAELAGILGVTREEVVQLTDDAQRLGATTAFTAEQVTRLQLEYAKLGKSQSEIIDLTEATINLSIATNKSAAEAAAFVGTTLNQFNLTTREAAMVVDVLGKAFTSSALDFEKLKEGFKDSAPVAAQFGFNVQETAAFLATLADAGIDGTKAGTALRNMFIQLNKRGLGLHEGLKLISDSSDKVGTATELVGVKSAVSAVILANYTAKTDELTEALLNAGGTTEALAKEQLRTLDGSIKLLQSAWSGLILDIENGNGALGKFINIIIRTVTKVIELSSSVTQFKSILFGVPGAIASWTKALVGLGKKTDDAITLQDTLNKTIQNGREGMKLYNDIISETLEDIPEPDLEIVDAELVRGELVKIGKIINETLPEYKKKAVEKSLSLEEQIQLAGDKAIRESSAKGYRKYQKDITNILLEEEEKRKAIQKEGFKFGAEAGNAFFEIRSGQITAETTRLAEQKNAELAAAGDNADKRAKIEAEYAKKEAALRRKAAINEKMQSLFSIAIKTAEGIINYSSKVATLPLVPFVIATGAVQAATVAAQPIPKFAKGTDYAPKRGIFGEAGDELMRTKSGEFFHAEQATLFDDMKFRGAKIWNAGETKQILSGESGGKSAGFDAERIVRAINSKPETKINISPAGIRYATKKGNNWVIRMKRL